MTAGASQVGQAAAGATTAIPLRPRSVSELVDASFLLLKRGFPAYVLIVGLIEVPWFVLSTVYSESVGIDPVQPDFLKIPLAWWLFQVVGGSVILALLESTLALAVSDSYFGRVVDVRSVFARCFERFLSISLLAIVRNLMLFIGLTFLIVPGIWLGVRYFVAMPALVIEDVSARRAVVRSSGLAKGHALRVLKAIVLMLALYAVVVIGALMLGGMAMMRSVPMIAQVLSLVGYIVALPLFSAIQTLLYYDLRIRKEGFDIEVMSRSLGGTTPVRQTA